MKPKLFYWLSILTISIFSEFTFAEKVTLDPDLIPLSTSKEKTDEISDEKLSKIAFENLIKKIKEFTPEQRRQLQELERKQTEALNRDTPPEVINDIILVDTSPGAKIQRIFLTNQLDTFVSIIDATGKPWPLAFKSVGGDLFKADEVPTEHKNMLKLTTNYQRASTNLSLVPLNMETIVTIELIATTDKYHSNAIVQLDVIGPNAAQRTNKVAQAISFDDELEKVVLGFKPSDKAKRLETSSRNVLAWLGDKGALFLRTKLNLKYPNNPMGVRHGMNGYSAYKIRYLPIFTMSDDNGVIEQVRFKEPDNG